MFNILQGPNYSAGQSNFIGAAKANEGVVAGMLVRKNASGEIVKAGAASGDATIVSAILGFAVRDQNRPDVVESGKLSAYHLDGSSVIATDQTAAAINLTNYPVGTRLTADTTPTGKLRAWSSATDRVVGYADGVDIYQGTSVLRVKVAV